MSDLHLRKSRNAPPASLTDVELGADQNQDRAPSSEPGARRAAEGAAPADTTAEADTPAEAAAQQKKRLPPLKYALAFVLWLHWTFFWGFFSVDWQRVRYLFRVYMLDDSYKIVDSSLVKEQDLLQTSAVFLFSAGLVTNFLSGAPWELGNIKSIIDLLHANSTITYNPLRTPEEVWGHGTTRAATFRSMWGTCMLFTLMAVICAYVSRTALFLCWSLIRMNLEVIRKAARKEAKRVSHELGAYAATAESIDAAAEAATKTAYKSETGDYQKLGRVVFYIAFAVSLSKLLFITSLLLWLVTITFAIVELYRLRERDNGVANTNGAVVVTIAAIITLWAAYAFWRLLADCWTAFALWKPGVQREGFLDNCAEDGIWKTYRAEPKMAQDTVEVDKNLLEKVAVIAIRTQSNIVELINSHHIACQADLLRQQGATTPFAAAAGQSIKQEPAA